MIWKLWIGSIWIILFLWRPWVRQAKEEILLVSDILGYIIIIVRHYNLLYVEPFLPNSLQRIFFNIIEWFFLNNGKDMGKQIQNLGDKIVISTIQIYNTIKQSKELLPTPAKSHYIYNLRDISKVF